MKRAWILEADSVKDADDIIQDTILTTVGIRSFLDIASADTKFILSGPRGSGKTLLIKFKSKLYREHKHGYRFIPENELCDKMYTANVSFSKDSLEFFKNESLWTDIWSITIACSVLLRLRQSSPIEFPAELSVLLKQAESIPDVLTRIIQSPRSIIKLQPLLAEFLLPNLRKIREPIAVFVDSIDEAFNNHIGRSYYDYAVNKRAQKGALDPKIWTYAQTGILHAAKKLHQANRHIRVFAAIRCEALSLQETPSLQDREYITEIKYSKDDLRWIFESNIQRMDADQLFGSDDLSSMERFLGLKSIPHAFVTAGDSQPVVEDPFEYLLRHTFGRPRELIMLGKRVAELSMGERSIDLVKEVVNATAVDNLRFYENDILPFWNEQLVRSALSRVRANVLSREKITAIAREVTKEIGESHPFCYLFQRGLIGYVTTTEDGASGKHQVFADLSVSTGIRSLPLPRADFYVLHPAVASDQHIRSNAFEFDRFNVVGNGYPFASSSWPKRVGTESRKLHVHFGAGRLGLGLCLPILRPGHCICVVYIIRKDSQSEARHMISQDGKIIDIDIDVSGHCYKWSVCSIGENTEGASVASDSAFNYWCSGHDLLLLIAEDSKTLVDKFVDKAVSFSTAIKDGLPSVSQRLSINSNRVGRVPCYCFENDFDQVSRFAEQLRVSAPFISVKKVISDRICSDVVFDRNPRPWIYVNAETWHEVIIFDPDSEVIASFPDGNVKAVTNDRVFKYYYARKFWLLNGVHVLLAVAAYYKMLKEGRDPKTAGEIHIPTLFEDEDFAVALEKFLLIQSARLLYAHRSIVPVVYRGKDIMYAMGAVRAYGETLLSRLREYDDRLGRILPFDSSTIVGKFLSRVDSIRDFAVNDWGSLMNLGIEPPMSSSEAVEFVDGIRLQMLDVVKRSR